MADADVAITAGAGTKIDTRTVGAGTDEHRQVVVIGDPATAANVASADAANGLDVDVTRLPALPAGTNNIGDVDVLTLPNVTIGAGDVDNDAVNTAKVVQVGGHASAQTTPPTAVSAAGDRVRAWHDLNGAYITRPRKLATYRAVVRATARPYVMSNVFGAAGRKQFATIHHAASATKTVRLTRVLVTVSSSTAQAFIAFELVRITAAPVTGNPAISTLPTSDAADAAAEATVLALPTTAGTEQAAPYSTGVYNLGITGAVGTVNPPPPVSEISLLTPSAYDGETKAPVIRAGVLEGWAVTCDVNAATTISVPYIILEFTED